MKTLQCLTDKFAMPAIRNGKNSEFEVQAQLFVALKNDGYDVRGEVRWTCPKKQRTGPRAEVCRFDLVIYQNGRACHILEVKAAPVNHKFGVENTRQGQRYRHFGIPVTFIYGPEDVAEFIRFLSKNG